VSLDLGAFLGGSTVATVISLALAGWRDHRDVYRRHDADLLAAHHEFLTCLEECRAVVMPLVLLRASSVGDIDKWLDRTSELTLDVMKRLGAARTRLALAEDSADARNAASKCWEAALAGC
jgi:hypothetical protein